MSVITLFNFIIVPISICLTLPKLIGVDSVWISQAVPGLLCFVGLVAYSTNKRRRFPRKYAEVTNIPESFGIENCDRFDATVKRFRMCRRFQHNPVFTNRSGYAIIL